MTEFAVYTTYCDRCNPAHMMNPTENRLNQVEMVTLPNNEVVMVGGGWIQCSRESASLIGWQRISNGEDICPSCVIDLASI